MSGSPREEAERLVATVLGMASLAAGGLDGYATGSAECCTCPVCRAIATLREPDPQFAERLATGAGDLAAGLAGVLRAFATRDAPAAGAPETGTPETEQPGAGAPGAGEG